MVKNLQNKKKNSVIEKHHFRLKTQKVEWIILYADKITLVVKYSFQAGLRSSALSCCNNHYNILLFEEQMWPLHQLFIFKFINLVAKRTSTSITGQALFSRNFIKPTISFGASLHILYHSIMVFIC